MSKDTQEDGVISSRGQRPILKLTQSCKTKLRKDEYYSIVSRGTIEGL